MCNSGKQKIGASLSHHDKFRLWPAIVALRWKLKLSLAMAIQMGGWRLGILRPLVSVTLIADWTNGPDQMPDN